MGMNIFDNVKYEKKKAMERFNKFQRMKKMMKVFEIVCVLALLSWSTKKIPSVVRFSSMVFEDFVSCLNPHFVFLIGNSIILALFLLCKQHGPGNSSGDNDINHISVYHEYSCSGEASALTSQVPLTSSGGGSEVVEEEGEENKGVVESVQCEEVEEAIAAAEHEIRRFQRTLSEKLKRDIGVRQQRKELRRSETENGRGSVGGEGVVVKPLMKTVEHLSNEEFKLAIDDFIDKHRVFSKAPVHFRYK